jgi:hypothetical protein
MSALTVFIIRHGEKPKELWPGAGLQENGSRNKKSLVIRGWERAGAWAALFGAGLGGADYPTPSVIYAADPKGAAQSTSPRPFETVQPLASRLDLRPVTTFGLGEETGLVAEVTKLTGCVLICWEHKAIAKAVLPKLLGPQRVPGVPKKWDSLRFDVVLRLDRATPNAPWSFRQLFPRLLSGDMDKPMR